MKAAVPIGLVGVYLHRRASDNRIFYVGKGVGARPWWRHHRSAWWRSIVSSHGLVVELVSVWRTNKEACDHEVFLIGCFRGMGFELCNLTNGGEGAMGRRHSDEAKKKISEANRGRKRTKEHVEAMSAVHRGRPKSEEHKAKISAAHKGVKKRPEVVAAYMPTLLAAMARPEVRQKISAAARNRVVSEETRKKMSESRRGRAQSQEERERRSASLKKFHAEKKKCSKLSAVPSTSEGDR